MSDKNTRVRTIFDGNHEAEEWARSIWGQMVTERNEEIKRLRDENRILVQYKEKAIHFDLLLKGIKENKLAKEYWDRMMFVLKLTER